MCTLFSVVSISVVDSSGNVDKTAILNLDKNFCQSLSLTPPTVWSADSRWGQIGRQSVEFVPEFSSFSRPTEKNKCNFFRSADYLRALAIVSAS